MYATTIGKASKTLGWSIIKLLKNIFYILLLTWEQLAFNLLLLLF